MGILTIVELVAFQWQAGALRARRVDAATWDSFDAPPDTGGESDESGPNE